MNKEINISVRGTFSDDKQFNDQKKAIKYIQELLNSNEEGLRITIDAEEVDSE